MHEKSTREVADFDKNTPKILLTRNLHVSKFTRFTTFLQIAYHAEIYKNNHHSIFI